MTEALGYVKYFLLILTQGRHGVQTCRPLRRDVTGQDGRGNHRERDGHEGQRIFRPDAVQQMREARQRAGQRERAHRADSDASRASRSPRPITIRKTSRFSAPSAMRIPTSRTRCVIA